MYIRRVENVLDEAMPIDESAGIYRCRRDIFTDPDLFELEMKYLFEGGWVYLAHESQIAEVNDYFTTYIGRQPVVITRDKNNEDRKSTRLNSSHVAISYAVFCLKKKI